MVKNEDGIDTAIGSSQSHCQGIETTQTWTVNKRYENMFGHALASCSQTLLNVLFHLSPKLQRNLPVAMVENMVTCDVINSPTLLQIALGVVIREKTNIELLHGLGIMS